MIQFSRLFRWLAFAGVLWSATAQAQLTGEWTIYLSPNEVRDVVAVGNQIYAATSGGALRFAPESGFVQWNREVGGLASDSLGTVAVDQAGRVWFGTEVAGISQLDPVTGRWSRITALLEPIAGNSIRRVRIQGAPDGEYVMIGAADGFSVFVDGDLRFICQQGVDICDIPSFDVLDLALRDGRIFLTTAGGVAGLEPDGSFVDASDGLGGAILHALTQDGDLYGASAEAVFRWNGSSWEEDSAGLPGNGEMRELFRGDGGLYLATSRGVYRRDTAQWVQVGERNIPATSVAITEDGTLYAGATDPAEVNGGLWAWDGAEWTQYRKEGPSPRAYYRSLHFAESGDLWFSTAQNGRFPLLGRYTTENTWDLWTSFGGETAVAAWTFGIGEAFGRVWFAHCCCAAGGDCRVESLDLESVMFEALSEIDQAWRFDVDPDGNLWTCTNAGVLLSSGLWRIDENFQTQNFSPTTNRDLKSTRVTSLQFDGRRLWIGYPSSGVSIWNFGPNGIPEWKNDPETGNELPNDDSWTELDSSTFPPLIGDAVTQIRRGSDGRIWIATSAGISIYDNGAIENIGPSPTRFPSAIVNDLLPTDDGGAWIASASSGVTRMTPNDDGYDYETFVAQLPNPNVNALALDPAGETLWMGTTRGLASFRPRGTVVSDTDDRIGLYPNPLRPECVDGLRVLGAGGQASGVVVDLSGRRLARFDERQPGEIIWDGRVDGEPVAPGLYIVQLRTPRGTHNVGLSVMESNCGP